MMLLMAYIVFSLYITVIFGKDYLYYTSPGVGMGIVMLSPLFWPSFVILRAFEK